MARDAIARQYDVDKNLVTLTCDPSRKEYSSGVIAFFPKKGKALDLDRLQESITATRLSGGTNMGVDYLEITARGEVVATDKEMTLKMAGADQDFILGEEPGAKDKLASLREAVASGAKVTTVTGRVPGWTGRFPDVLKALAKSSGPRRLLVTDFEVSK